MSLPEIVKVKNRTNKKFEWQYDGVVYTIEANGHLLTTRAAGFHGIRRSIYSLDPIAEKAVFRLGVDGETDCTPLDAPERVELVERASGLPKVVTKKLVNPVGQERAGGDPAAVMVSSGPSKT